MLKNFDISKFDEYTEDNRREVKKASGERIDDTPVHKALREALANCLINADYHGLRGVVIRKETDKIILKWKSVLYRKKRPSAEGLFSYTNLIFYASLFTNQIHNLWNRVCQCAFFHRLLVIGACFVKFINGFHQRFFFQIFFWKNHTKSLA